MRRLPLRRLPLRRLSVRRLSLLLPVLLVAGLLAPTAPARAAGPDLTAFRGLGTWVDGWDFSRELTSRPSVTPASVAAMKDRGVRTIYLQAAKESSRTPGSLLSPDRLGQFLLAAHSRGMQVVAWYLPTFERPSRDWMHVDAMMQFTYRGQHFDGIGIDIESTTVPVRTRNARLVDLSRRAQARTWLPVAAIVLPPVLTEIIHPGYWGGSFPWSDIARSYDVWIPMGYYTAYRTWPKWRDAATSTAEDIRRLRGHVGAQAPVHYAGGLAGDSTRGDYQGFTAAARQAGALGVSAYDYATTPAWAWTPLRAGAR